ncbi:MAG: hypothetical protein NC908_03775, partial [Candidatus Omnitrophica bacterium]|nr:hypothetical protein [Candidatus Omnitrophota bacterium]
IFIIEPDTGKEASLPVNLLVKERLSFGNFAFGYQDPKSGARFKFFLRHQKDTSKWNKDEFIAPGVEAEIPITDKVGVGLEGMYKKGRSQAAGFIELKLSEDIRIITEGHWYERYNYKGFSVGIEGTIPGGFNATLKGGIDYFKGGKLDRFGLDVEVINLEKKKKDKLPRDEKGRLQGPEIPNVNPAEPYYPKPTQVIGTEKEMEKTVGERDVYNGKPVVWGKKAMRLFEEYSGGLAIKYYLDGSLPMPIKDNEELAKAIPVKYIKPSERTKYGLEVKEGKYYLQPFSKEIDKDTVLLLVPESKFPAIVELGEEGLKQSYKIETGVGVVFGKNIHILEDENKFREMIERGGLYGELDEEGHTVLNIDYQGIKGVLKPGEKGLKILRGLETSNIAKIIEHKTGRIGYLTNKNPLRALQKMYLVPKPRSPPTGFELKFEVELTREEKALIKDLAEIDALIMPSGERYLVEYNPAHLKLGPAINFISEKGEELDSQPIDIEAIKKGYIPYKDYYKIKQFKDLHPKFATKDKIGIVEVTLFGEKVNLQTKVTPKTLIYPSASKEYIVYFSPELQAFFKWVDTNIYVYQVIPQQGLKLYFTKMDVPSSWYPERVNEIVIIGKPNYTANYNEAIKKISAVWGMSKEKLEEKYYNKEKDQGAVFDLKTAGIVVFTDMGKDAVWMIRYKDDQKRVVTEGLRHGNSILREIVPYVVTFITYKAGKELDAKTYLTNHRRLEEFRYVDSEEQIKTGLLKKGVLTISDAEVYNLPFLISGSEKVEYNSLPWKKKIDFLVGRLKADGFNLLEEMCNLRWVKITYYDPYDRALGYSYQAFGRESSLPQVKIFEGKMLTFGEYKDVGELVDIVVRPKDKTEEISLRFDLDLDKDKIYNPVAISKYAKFPTDKLIVDIYKELVFIDVREESQGYWKERQHLFKRVWLNNKWEWVFDHDWRWIVEHLDEIAKNKIERVEELTYNKDLYSSLLKALDITLAPFTKYLVYIDGQTKLALIGEGKLKLIDWLNGLIISSHEVYLGEKTRDKAEPSAIFYKTWRDFRGDVRLQFMFKDALYTEPTLGAYVYDIDKYGIGQKSMTVVKMKNKDIWIPFIIGKFDKTLEGLTLKNIKGEDYKAKVFLFEVTRINKPIALELNNSDFLQDYTALYNKYDTLTSPDLIRTKYKTGRSGEGRVILQLEGYRYDKRGNLIGEPLWITFNLYDIEILSGIEAGVLDLGYAKASYKYEYDSEKGFDSANYAKPTWWPRFKSIFGYKIDSWKDSGAKEDTSRGGIKKREADVFVNVGIKSEIKGRELQKQLILNPWGTINEIVNDNPKVRVMKGLPERVVKGLGFAVKGKETVFYDELERPLYAVDDEGRITQDWRDEKGEPRIKYEITPEGYIKETHTIEKFNSLGPNIKHNYELILKQGEFDDEIRIGILRDWGRSIWENILIILSPLIWIAGLLFIGTILALKRWIISRRRIGRVNNPASDSYQSPQQLPDDEIPEPSYRDYGFVYDDIVAVAKYSNQVRERLRKGENLDKILNEFFEGYQKWRKEVMGIQEESVPTLEDLWIFFLVKQGATSFRNDTPSLLNYMLHKALEKKDNSIGNFVREEYERWNKIVFLALTNFKGIGGKIGERAQIVPYQFLFGLDDVEDMFRTRKFVEFYD